MEWAGQWLVDPSQSFRCLERFGLFGLATTLFVLYTVRTQIITSLVPNLTLERFWYSLVLGGVLSIVSTLVLTLTSVIFFDQIAQMTGANKKVDRTELARLDYTQKSSFDHAVGYSLVRGVQSYRTSPKAGRAVGIAIVIVVLICVIGAGYACSALDLGFWGHFVSMSCGIGLPEELTKAAAGLLVLYTFFDTRSVSPGSFRRFVLAAFGLAGLGFGAGEAIKYFGVYAHHDVGLFCYLIRGTWCVTLHGAWTLLVGAALAGALPQDPSALKDKGQEIFFALLFACIPLAIAHGLYDAFCFHDGVGALVVGCVSLVAAGLVIDGFTKEKEVAVG